MKKKILISALVMIMSLSVGCVNKSNAKDDTNKNTEESIEKVKSNEEMYEIYESHIEQVKEIAIKYGIDLEDKSNEQKAYNDKVTSLYKYDQNGINGSDIYRFKYVSVIDENGNIKNINANMDIKYTEKFKMEESKFSELRKLFTNEQIEYSKINEKINSAIENSTIENITSQYSDITESILVNENGMISYSVIIYP